MARNKTRRPSPARTVAVYVSLTLACYGTRLGKRGKVARIRIFFSADEARRATPHPNPVVVRFRIDADRVSGEPGNFRCVNADLIRGTGALVA